MALLTTNFVSRAVPLSSPAFASCSAGGDTFAAGSEVYLHVKNGAGTAATVTVATPGNVQGIAESGYQFTVPATTGDIEVGPFPTDLFGETASITYSAVTTLTILVKSMGQ
jgi:hypothetical protein